MERMELAPMATLEVVLTVTPAAVRTAVRVLVGAKVSLLLCLELMVLVMLLDLEELEGLEGLEELQV